MLSILIPVFNYDCSKLIADVHHQATMEQIPFEILVYDDCSTRLQPLSASVLALPNVKYHIMETNQGRSCIRNLLAAKASYNNLLFLDCDSAIVRNDFIKTYIGQIGTADCICGGTTYPNPNDVSREYILHLTYGIKREMAANKQAVPSFMANNFLIRRDIFMKLHFDETILGYGHEDTLFGIMLRKNKYSLRMIDNPVMHLGLTKMKDFLNNNKVAAMNLRLLYNNPKYTADMASIRLVKTYNKIHKTGFDKILRMFRKPLSGVLRSRLSGSRPSLFALDLYKLIWFCS
ncbi:MAG: glycosyltransferase family 2 protein [Bacteroidales bacterium]|jgi:glycosyltransferase involved in cell wall biosynthesis|nr:glycosyltransferase family 2 protein [Bacteroidales bacterium]